MKRNLLLGLAMLILAAAATTIFYYRGISRSDTDPPLAFEEIQARGLASTEFTDTFKKTEGRIVFDLSHDNDFTLSEVNLLSLRLANRGLSIEYFEKDQLDKDKEEISLKDKLFRKDEADEDKADNDNEEASPEDTSEPEDSETEDANLEDEDKDAEQKDAKAMVIIAPRETFSEEDLGAIKDFVEGGGRLLLIGDPTRPSEINRLAVLHGLIFESDYLYNLKENGGNYRNTFFSEFKENKITGNVQEVVLFTAGSISSDDRGIAFGDENTRSSLITSAGSFSPIALARGARVLAVYDLTFMTEPYNSLLDNNRLISNIANWLAGLPNEIPEEEEEEPPTTLPE
ncbi:hypothetical protein ACFLWB_00810 [Chloroflexota bacterium]